MEVIERRTIQRLNLRILPFLFLLYMFSFLDRSNVGIAALQLNKDLRFSPAVFGFGAGLFSLGYSLFEIPSNFVLSRVGARRWIARIMVCWGVLATATMFVHTAVQFYVIRFLLGVAEAGFFPGVIYYIAQWYPMTYRARAAAVFTVAIPFSQVISGAIGGPLLELNGTANLFGWQWLFLLEGVPSIALGIVVWLYLTDRPSDALWLPLSDRDWLLSRLKQDQETSTTATTGYWHVLRTPVCWWLAMMYFCFLTIGVGYTSWIALFVREALGTRDAVTGYIIAGISLIAAVAYLLTARFSDKTNDRYLFAIVGLALCVAGCLGATFAPTPWLKVSSLAVIPFGSGVFLPSFWCLPTMKFDGPSVASSIALVSAVGSTGGFFGPFIIGYLMHSIGGNTAAFLTLAVIGVLGCTVGIVLRRQAFVTPAKAALRPNHR